MTLETYQELRRPTSAVPHRAPFDARRFLLHIPRWLALTSVALGMAASAAVPASSATAPTLTPDSLSQAQAIRAQVTAHYRSLPGRKLVVTGATSMHGVPMFVLMTADWLDARFVAADNGIFFDTCSARATCPYPGRRAAWRVDASTPRRQALELALRTFLETTASLVVVSLPTAQPVWAVYERDDLLASIDASAVLDLLVPGPALNHRPLRELVDRLTRPRLFVPLAIGADDSIIAARLYES